jgi:hypothetical protein
MAQSEFSVSLEDSDAEYYIIKMALRETGIPIDLHRVSDGEEALSFLHKIDGSRSPLGRI